MDGGVFIVLKAERAYDQERDIDAREVVVLTLTSRANCSRDRETQRSQANPKGSSEDLPKRDLGSRN